MRNEFDTFHPLVSFFYFAFVILLSMICMNPICQAISVICGFLYSVMLNGTAQIKTSLKYMLPVLFLSAAMNPLFNHAGIHIITYMPNGNPLTLEAVLYGLGAAGMLISVIFWFLCYNKVITSDKFIYLFGRIIPSLSLVFSMVIGFVPKLGLHMKEIKNARRAINNGKKNNLINRIKSGLSVISALTTQTLEASVDTADSMKSRGYGLPNRTAFSNFRFDMRDGVTLCVICASTAYIMLGFGILKFSYFPSLDKIPLTPYAISLYTVYFILCIIPMAIEIFYNIVFKRRISK